MSAPTAETIRELVRAAGVVGAGGAGFPTHAKLSTTVERVLANGASCEPLLASDPYLMEHEPEAILRGLAAVMNAVTAEQGSICLKAKHAKVMATLKKTLAASPAGPDQPRIDVVELDDFYPAGDEQVLVYEVMGRVVPEGGLPLQVGAVVSNVESLYNVARALEGRPVTERFLTVAGEVARPLVVRVPIGISLGEVLALAGGTTKPDLRIVVGGPMMGQVAPDLDQPVTKTTSGLIALPADHHVIAGKIRDPERIRRITRLACCQCSRCTDLCPRNLLGHGLAPHRIMRRLGLPGQPAREELIDALICSECGVCEKFACPMMISPREVNAQIKRELLGAGVRRAAPSRDYRPSAYREFRRVPTRRLLEKLVLSRYDGHPEFRTEPVRTDRVAIPLKQHLGAPALPVVKVGQKVKKGDLIGEIPDKALGARVHASMDGRVTAVSDRIVIES